MVQETTSEPVKEPEPITTIETVIVAEALKEAESAPVDKDKTTETEVAAAAVVVAAAAASEPVVEVEVSCHVMSHCVTTLTPPGTVWGYTGTV